MSHFPPNSSPMPFAEPDAAGEGQATATAFVSAADAGPYSQPADGSARLATGAVDAMLIDAIRAAAGPYVPAPWRVVTDLAMGARAQASETATPTSAPTPAGLPWIDAFLDSDASDAPVEAPAPVRFAIPTPVTSIFAELPPTDERAAVEDSADAMFVAAPVDVPAADAEPAPMMDVTQDAISESSTDVDEANDEANDEWPLAEAGAAMESLAAELVGDRGEPTVDASTEPTETADDRVAPMSAWTDDDIMDIMPVRAADAPSPTNEHWAVQARREADGSSSTEAAAAVLEALARRVRDGELVLPGYTAEMGDAAALAAALAALLGVRR